MFTLQDFLNENPVDNLTEDVMISDRFKDQDGNLLKFRIKAMTSQEFDEIRKSCSIMRNRKIEFDAQRFNLQMVINHTIQPDFKHAESIHKLACHNPEEYVQRVLLAGEVATLAQQIQQLSGFDIDMDTLVEEAKN